MTTFRTFVADSDGVNAEYDKPKPKRGLARQVQKHVQGLSPERKAALGRIMKKAGIAGLAAYAANLITKPATEVFAGEGDGEWACKPPEYGRTNYYPVTGNGNFDDVAQVDELDRLTDDLNVKTFGYDSEDVRSFHDHRCANGCVDTITEPATLTTELADAYYAAVHDALGETIESLNAAADEQWVAVLIDKRYSNLSNIQDQVSAISQAAGQMLGTSNNAAQEAHSLLRNTVKKNRADLANGYANGESGFSWTATAAGAVAGLRGGIVGAGAGALGAGLVSGLWNDKFPEDVAAALDTRLDEAASKATAALEDNDEAVEMFRLMVEQLGSRNLPGETIFDKAKGVWDKVTSTVGDILPDSLPGAGDLLSLGSIAPETISPLGDVQDTPPGTTTPTKNTSPISPLGNLGNPLGTSLASSPLGDMGTSPLGSTTPTESMTPAAFDQLMGEDPETPELFEGEPVEDEEVEISPLGEDLAAAEDEDTDTDVSDEDAAAEDEELITDEDGEVVTEDEPAAPEPTDEELRTVELPDGRSVTFPTAEHAAMVRELLNDEGAGTIYAAADMAGFTLPPVGQDIGAPVPPMDVREGDIVRGAEGAGVAIGNGEVLMENGDIRPIEEVSTVDAAGHGIFRLDAPADVPVPADDAAAAPDPVAGDPVPVPAPVLSEQTPPAAPVVEDAAPVPVVGGEQPDPVAVEGDPLDLLRAG
ncbi:MAG: hypothetical protein KDB26_09380 [Microthrixaceae bacterium]|nr:hypothetical protein [Microthrixaceae bacterium]